MGGANPAWAQVAKTDEAPSSVSPPYQSWNSSHELTSRGCSGPRGVGPTIPVVLVLTPAIGTGPVLISST